MIIKNDRQRARLCRALLAPHKTLDQVDQLFTFAGPTSAAWTLYKQDGGAMSSGEQTMFLVAMSVWTNSTDHCPTIADALFRLDGANLGRLAEIFHVLAQPDSDQADEYLDRQEAADFTEIKENA